MAYHPFDPTYAAPPQLPARRLPSPNSLPPPPPPPPIYDANPSQASSSSYDPNNHKNYYYMYDPATGQYATASYPNNTMHASQGTVNGANDTNGHWVYIRSWKKKGPTTTDKVCAWMCLIMFGLVLVSIFVGAFMADKRKNEDVLMD